MNDKARIIAALVVFFALAAFPTWYMLGFSRAEAAAPELEYPSNGASACVEDTVFMASRHMNLLNQWRNAVVREGQYEYTSSSGETFVMSLTGTCLECHEDKDAFCTRCHDFAGVTPTCWDCHLDSRGN
jgi:hypothetical protein